MTSVTRSSIQRFRDLIGGQSINNVQLAEGALNIGSTPVSASGSEITRNCDVGSRIVNHQNNTTLTLSPSLHESRVVVVTRSAGVTITLPTASGSGARYEVRVGVTLSGNVVIRCANAIEVLRGNAILAQDGGDTSVMFEAGVADDTITLNGSTTGGTIGAIVRLIDMLNNTWGVEVISAATGTEATPFSAAVV